MAGVQNFLSIVLGSFITAGENNRVGALAPSARDACPARPMYSGFREINARGKPTAFRISWRVSEDALRHRCSFYPGVFHLKRHCMWVLLLWVLCWGSDFLIPLRS